MTDNDKTNIAKFSTTIEDWLRLLAETKDLSEEKGNLEVEIVDLERARAIRVQQLAAYKEEITYQYPY